jgi:hypothetical protein
MDFNLVPNIDLLEKDTEEGWVETFSLNGKKFVIDEDGIIGQICNICSECLQDLTSRRIPKFSLKNDFCIGRIPKELRNLTVPERMFIAKVTTEIPPMQREFFTSSLVSLLCIHENIGSSTSDCHQTTTFFSSFSACTSRKYNILLRTCRICETIDAATDRGCRRKYQSCFCRIKPTFTQTITQSGWGEQRENPQRSTLAKITQSVIRGS